MLSRRWLINFVLLILILVFTYIGNRYHVQTGYKPENAITRLNPAEIKTISIKTADETLQLRRSEGNWQIESPIYWPASNINVERLLTITRAETDSRLGADQIDLASIGLQFPRAMLQLDDTSILFGTTNNIGERRYLMIDSTVFLLPDLYFPLISHGLIGIVDRRLLPASKGLLRLKLTEFELTRSHQGSWQTLAAAQFSEDQIQRLIDNWQGLQATHIKRYAATTTPRQKIIAHWDDGRSQTFFVVSISPEIIIANPDIGLQYHFNSSFYYQLLALRDELKTEN